jgi:hypothetical protein
MSFEAFIQGILAESQSTYFIYLNVTLKEQTTQSTLTFKQFINLNILVYSKRAITKNIKQCLEEDTIIQDRRYYTPKRIKVRYGSVDLTSPVTSTSYMIIKSLVFARQWT